MTPLPSRPPFQFGMRALFGVTVLLSMLAAIGGQLVRRGAEEQKSLELIAAIVLALVAPFLALIGASAYRVWRRREGGARRKRDDW